MHPNANKIRCGGAQLNHAKINRADGGLSLSTISDVNVCLTPLLVGRRAMMARRYTIRGATDQDRY